MAAAGRTSATSSRLRALTPSRPPAHPPTRSPARPHCPHPARPPHSASDRIPTPAFLFDLDGTLVDSVYQHVLAWREALEHDGIELAVWRIHRRIGMSGGPADQRAPPRDRPAGHPRADRPAPPASMPKRTPGSWPRCARCPAPASCSPTSPARACRGPSPPAAGWRARGRRWRCWASARMRRSSPATRSATPSPIPTCSSPPPPSSASPIEHSVVVGDSVWDMLAARRARALGVGLLSGGYGEEELNAPAPTGSTRIRPTCCSTSTRSAYGTRSEPAVAAGSSGRTRL